MNFKNFKKVLFSTLATILVVLLFLTGTYLLVTSRDGTGEDLSQTEVAAEQEEDPLEQASMQEPELFLQSFAEVLYTYDTRERRFYEGTEAFMTPQVYAELAPLSAEDETESGENIPAVISSLQEAKCYYSCFSETEAEVIMESCFTLSGSGNGQILQYIKLNIEKQDNEWIITGINVLDTLEQ